MQPEYQSAKKLAIYTGSNDIAFHFAVPMLKSLFKQNDLDLPVIFFDFGMSPHQREIIWSSGVSDVIDVRHYTDQYIGLTQRMNATQGTLGIHLARTMKKVAILEANLFNNFLWIDADTIILEPLSRFVPKPPYDAIWAQRLSRGSAHSQLRAAPEQIAAVENRVNQQLGLSGTHQHINSGVFAMNAANALTLVEKHASFLIGDMGEHLFGDQSFINLAAWAEGIPVRELDAHVNVCVPNGFSGHVELRGLDILINGDKPWIYHFLNYKPAPNKQASTPAEQTVQAFYDAWRAA